MDVNKADAHTVDDDIIEVIVAIDTNPSKKSKPLNSKNKEKSALKDLETEESDDGEESSEEKDSKDKENGDEPDWKSLCEQLLQAISVLDPDADEVVDSKMTDEEMLKAIDVVLDGKSAPEDKDPFSSYQEGGTHKESREEKKPRSSGGFKGAAKKLMGAEDEEPEEDDDDNLLKPEDFDIPNFNKEEEDEDNDQKSSSQNFNKKQFNSAKKSQRPAPRKAKGRSDSGEERFPKSSGERETEEWEDETAPKKQKGFQSQRH